MSKMKFYDKAEKMFLYENLSPDEIAGKLNISRRTIYYWREKYNWDEKKFEIERNKKALSAELFEFLKTLVSKITKDMDNKIAVNQSELYSLINLLKYMPELQKYDKTVKTDKNETSKKELSPELIMQIQRDILGMDV